MLSRSSFQLNVNGAQAKADVRAGESASGHAINTLSLEALAPSIPTT